MHYEKLMIVRDNNDAARMAKRFYAGEAEFQTDRKWWDLVDGGRSRAPRSKVNAANWRRFWRRNNSGIWRQTDRASGRCPRTATRRRPATAPKNCDPVAEPRVQR